MKNYVSRVSYKTSYDINCLINFHKKSVMLQLLGSGSGINSSSRSWDQTEAFLKSGRQNHSEMKCRPLQQQQQQRNKRILKPTKQGNNQNNSKVNDRNIFLVIFKCWIHVCCCK